MLPKVSRSQHSAPGTAKTDIDSLIVHKYSENTDLYLPPLDSLATICSSPTVIVSFIWSVVTSSSASSSSSGII